VTNKGRPNEAGELRVSNGTVPDFDFSEGQEEALHKRRLTIAEEVHIPDYVILDFGFPKRTRASAKLPG